MTGVNAASRLLGGPTTSAAFLLLLVQLVAMMAVAVRLTAMGPYGDDLRRLGERPVHRTLQPRAPTGFDRHAPPRLGLSSPRTPTP